MCVYRSIQREVTSIDEQPGRDLESSAKGVTGVHAVRIKFCVCTVVLTNQGVTGRSTVLVWEGVTEHGIFSVQLSICDLTTIHAANGV